MISKQGWLLIAVIGSGVLLYQLAPVLTPFLMGALLAYMGDPLADQLQLRGLSRTLAVVCVFIVFMLFFILLLLLVIPLLQQQITLLMEKIPAAIHWIQQQLLPLLQQHFGLSVEELDYGQVQKALLKPLADAGVASSIWQHLSQSGAVIMVWLGNLLLIPVVTFYLLRDWDDLVAKVKDLLPRRWIKVVTLLGKECDEVLGAFIKGQLLVMLALACIYALGLMIVGLDLAFIIGLLAGLASIVPYLGFVVGIGLAVLMGLMQFGDVTHLLAILAVFGVGQALEGMVLTPLLVGDKIGLHPVAVIFAVLAGGQLFGFVGVLLALPVAAVIMVLLRHAHDSYLKSALYGQSPS